MKISNCVWPKSIDFNDKDSLGRTRFIQACKNGHNNVVKRHFWGEFSSTVLSTFEDSSDDDDYRFCSVLSNHNASNPYGRLELESPGYQTAASLQPLHENGLRNEKIEVQILPQVRSSSKLDDIAKQLLHTRFFCELPSEGKKSCSSGFFALIA